ncbi:photolyase/cryptochrome alpha/beta domain-containing protein, partial [Haematococcus lacustris]
VTARYGPGAQVITRPRPHLQAVQQVAAAVGARIIIFNRRYEPHSARCDQAVEVALAAQGCQVITFNASLLREPHEVKMDQTVWAGHFGTLTPFLKAWEKLGPIPAPVKPPNHLPVA